MIDILKTNRDNIIEFCFIDIVTHDDYQRILIPFLEDAIVKSGPLRILCDLRHLKKIEYKAIWDDYKFGINHLNDFQRFATVGDQRWVSWLMKICGLCYKIKLKHFKSEQMNEARKWIKGEI